MNITPIEDYPWPEEITAAGLTAEYYPALFVLRNAEGKWFYSSDFWDGQSEDTEQPEPHFVIWVRKGA